MFLNLPYAWRFRTSFEAKNYGALLVVDPEAETSEHERVKLKKDVKEKGLSLVFFADWYSTSVMDQVSEHGPGLRASVCHDYFEV